MTPPDAARALRAVAALRALCLALPHVATPAERARLGRFEALAASPHGARDEDVDTLAAGWRDWWRRGRSDELLRMAGALPPRLIGGDRRLAAYLRAAESERLARDPEPRRSWSEDPAHPAPGGFSSPG
jgi:hypothetical protein